MTPRLSSRIALAALVSVSALAVDSIARAAYAQAPGASAPTPADTKDGKQHPHKKDHQPPGKGPAAGAPPGHHGPAPKAQQPAPAPKAAPVTPPPPPKVAPTPPPPPPPAKAAPTMPPPAPKVAPTPPPPPPPPAKAAPVTPAPTAPPKTAPAPNAAPAPNPAPAPQGAAPQPAPTAPVSPAAPALAPKQGATAPAAGRSPYAAALPPAPPPPPSGSLTQVQKERTQAKDGERTVIKEPGNRIIVKQDNRIIIQHDESERFRALGGANVRSQPGQGGTTETILQRPDGARVVSVTDAHGRLVQRYRREPSGREVMIIDNRSHFGRNLAIGVGIGALAVAAAVALAPPAIAIPREKYIVDYDRASRDDLYEALAAPPIEHLPRVYSLEEVRYSHALRERMRRIDLDAVNFPSGAWDVPPEQYERLQRIADAMLRRIDRHPEEVFLIEGHTDAVGSDIDNMSLSDRRAEAVADILTRTFGVPPENLVTQGYGEQYLKVPTSGPDPRNRRVSVRRITPLIAKHDWRD